MRCLWAVPVGHPFRSWIDGSGACKRDGAQVYDLGGITVSVLVDVLGRRLLSHQTGRRTSGKPGAGMSGRRDSLCYCPGEVKQEERRSKTQKL